MADTEKTYKEMYSRLERAIQLADVIWLSGVRASQMEHGAAREEFWRIAAKGAKCLPDYTPSPDTREVVIRLLRQRQETERRLTAAQGVTK